MTDVDEPSDDSQPDSGEGSIESSNSELELEVNDEELDLDEGDEFTLATLSEAYTEVVAAEAEGDPSDDLDTVAESDADELAADDTTEDADSQDDDTPCPVSPESIIESILFVGAPKDVKLTSRKIASVLRDVSPKEVAQIVKRLNARYKAQGNAWRISNEKGDYRMVLDDSLDSFKDDYFGRNREAKLNQSSIDVLAVVAYHQPATREEVDKIRGKASGSILNQLVKRELLIQEKTDGKPAKKLYRTTERFLDLFGLTMIEDLPQSHEVADIEELVD